MRQEDKMDASSGFDQVPLDQDFLRMGMDPQLIVASTWAIDVSDVRTVKVSNISLAASERDIKEFFSFSGDIQYIEMRSESERSQLAYVTFKESQGADTAMLLSGATIVDLSVSITPVEDYQLPPEAFKGIPEGKLSSTESAVRKAEDVVSSMLAKGFVLGKDALKSARSFDEQHHFTSNASATVASLDRKMGLSEKIGMGTAVVSGKVREVNERFQVSKITRSALSAAEQKASSAGSAIMGSRYVSTGASWLSSALGMVTKAAGDVNTMTREKVEKAEEERKEILCRERREIVDDFAQIHLDESSLGEPPTVPVDSVDEQKLQII
ncbi:binding partner of ACD11 1-like isoform X2 [Phoenix dactylifera]|uniref:Binding partner of ACD11 1-like isoform X2 n=1 Tax=Phoenix dactylifera TaxID=42345 RepID=A0A8B9AD02_PHODC|nr:binding partner of ACD11 1-like isoform X2 [Phoenix dactylifera]